MNQTTSVIVVPRERSSPAVDSLESIIENTPEPHELVYVNGSLTRGVARRVRSLVEARGGIYVDCHRWLRPNEARNIGISHATGRHLVFLDNDVFPQSLWLGRLTACARETGAGVVSPVYLEGDADAPTVHCAGGEIVRIQQDEGGIPMLVTKQYDLGKPVSELPSLRRGKVSLVEFHTVLVTRECLDAIGGRFDEGLETTREHVDLCLLAEQNGFDIYLEPGAVVRYGNESPPTLADIDYLMFRWSAAATERTIAHFERKWQVKLDPERTRIISHRRQRFLRAYRRSSPSRVYLATWKLAQRIPSARKTITFLLQTQ
jgi:GT2 family glycosyltransferase